MESAKDVGKNVEVNKILEAWKLVTILATTNEAYCEEYDSVKVKLVNEIIDKEIPKKPTKAIDGSDKDWASYGLCSNCESVRIHDYEYDRKFNRCSDCGQVIDWSKNASNL